MYHTLVNNPQNPIIIFGPTASGKTTLSVELAARLDAEIISADSQQIYADLEIGTARPTDFEMMGITHHMLGHVSVRETYNVSKFLEEIKPLISEIKNRGKTPIISGGSYMWIQSIVDGFSPTPPGDKNIRVMLEKRVLEEGLKTLHEELKKVDPVSADKISENDEYRIIRSLEIFLLTGKPRSEIFQIKTKLPFEFVKIGITRPRDILYDRINKRVDIMVELGFIEEVRELKERGLENEIRRVKAHGYPPILDYLAGKWSLDEALENMKMVTRRYAKRQLSFLRGRDDFKVFDSPTAKEIILHIKNLS